MSCQHHLLYRIRSTFSIVCVSNRIMKLFLRLVLYKEIKNVENELDVSSSRIKKGKRKSN